MKAQSYHRKPGVFLFPLMSFFWQKAIVYRFNICAYKIGEIGETILLCLIWLAIFSTQTTVGGFNSNEMITYLSVGALFNVLTRSHMDERVASDIRKGRLSSFIAKPFSYLLFAFYARLGTMSFHVIITCLISPIPLLIFSKYLIAPAQWGVVWMLPVMLIFGYITEWLIGVLAGLIAFWTTEVNGVQVTLTRLRQFFAGSYFPISLLPVAFVQVSFALPFAYNFFIPMQLYLGKIPLAQGLWGLLVQVVWIAILYGLVVVVWRKGLRKYEGVGT